MAGQAGSSKHSRASATYYATSANQQLREAQGVLDTHVTSSATGRCLECGTLGPCWRRENAVVVFSRTLRLPTHQPGGSQPELINARRIPMTRLPAGGLATL
jgi:hypothetical protein